MKIVINIFISQQLSNVEIKNVLEGIVCATGIGCCDPIFDCCGSKIQVITFVKLSFKHAPFSIIAVAHKDVIMFVYSNLSFLARLCFIKK